MNQSIKNEDNEFTVDNAEYNLIIRFIDFVRKKQRGVFKCEIVTHQSKRYVKLEFTDKDILDLKKIIPV